MAAHAWLKEGEPDHRLSGFHTPGVAEELPVHTLGRYRLPQPSIQPVVHSGGIFAESSGSAGREFTRVHAEKLETLVGKAPQGLTGPRAKHLARAPVTAVELSDAELDLLEDPEHEEEPGPASGLQGAVASGDTDKVALRGSVTSNGGAEGLTLQLGASRILREEVSARHSQAAHLCSLGQQPSVGGCRRLPGLVAEAEHGGSEGLEAGLRTITDADHAILSLHRPDCSRQREVRPVWVDDFTTSAGLLGRENTHRAVYRRTFQRVGGPEVGRGEPVLLEGPGLHGSAQCPVRTAPTPSASTTTTAAATSAAAELRLPARKTKAKAGSSRAFDLSALSLNSPTDQIVPCALLASLQDVLRGSRSHVAAFVMESLSPCLRSELGSRPGDQAWRCPVPCKDCDVLDEIRRTAGLSSEQFAALCFGGKCAPFRAERIKWQLPPTFNPKPFLDDPEVCAAYENPDCLLLPKSDWPALSTLARVHVKFLQKWDLVGSLYLVPAKWVEPKLRLGLFTVYKDSEFDRLILNPSVRNACSRNVSGVIRDLPAGYMLAQMHLRSDQELRLCSDDLREFYYSFTQEGLLQCFSGGVPRS
eukprot:5644825-Amphidinium_carterae.1